MNSTNLHETMHDSNDEQPSLEDAAQRYASLGWRVFPCNRDKSPLTEHGHKDATTDSHQIEAWWTEHPEASIGVACSKSGFFGLDVDPRHGGNATLAKLLDTHGPLPLTVQSHTGGGGQHFFFRLPEGCTLKGKLGQGVDVKSNGLLILPPSGHPSGGSYRWIHAPWDVVIADAPAWLLALVTQPAHASNGTGTDTAHAEFSDAKKAEILAELRQALPSIPADDHDTWLHVGMGIHSVESGADGFKIWREWSATCPEKFNLADCHKRWQSFDDKGGISHRTVFDLAKQHGWKAHSSAPRQDKNSTTPEAFTQTDTGNGQRLVVRHGENIRYVHPWKKWLVWNDMRWTLDNSGVIFTLAKDTARAIATDEAKQEHNDKQFSALLKWSTQSLNAPKLKAMLELAQSESGIPVQPEQLDTHSWLFNAQNGTLDLRSSALSPHSRSDLLTKLAPVAFDPEARCPQWEDFLEAIFNGNQELITWLQKAIGYSLTGDTREQCFFLLHGSGSNGKSTFIRILEALLGKKEYAETATFDTFLKQDNEKVRNDLATLKNARFVSAIEANEGQRLSEALIKAVTGGDTITARFLFSEYFSFVPAFKLWLATNHKPEIRGTDHAIWRRVRLIPFTVTFDEEKQDKGLLTKLQKELPGILAWAVRGCRAWREEGLDPVPDCVKAATEEYRSEQDVLGTFLTEHCILKPALQCPSGDLYAAYLEWARANGEQGITQQAFGKKLRERGLHNERSSVTGRKVWFGIGIIASRTES